jgi:putative transposase
LKKQKVVRFAQEKKRRQPKMGGRKLCEHIRKETAIKVGRDETFDILREADLLVKRQKKRPKTTDSLHRLKKYANEIKNLEVGRINQVFVSDITYIRTSGYFCYLSLITDVWSRKIVGYDVSENLMVEGSLRALDMALKEVRQEDELIHHSDRGIQYCCHEYVKMLNARGVRISMTEEDHVYENALAERVNGILKDELGLDAVFENVKEARKAVREAIEIYNNERLHMAIGYEIPAERYEKKAA